MNYKQKQQAIIKLAQVRLAINHVIRNRALKKSAATSTWTNPDGSTTTERNSGNFWNLWHYPEDFYRFYTGQSPRSPQLYTSPPKAPTNGFQIRNQSIKQQVSDPKLRKNPKDKYGGM